MQTPRSWAGLAVVVAVACSAGAFTACSEFTPPAPAGISGFAVNPRTAHINVGKTAQFHAIAAQGTVVWSSSDKTIATVDLGKVTGVASGTATIRAVSTAGSATATITVTRAAAIQLSSTSVTFTATSSGTLPDSQTVDVTNSGEDPLTGLQIDGVTYGGSASGWLSASLTQSSAPSVLVLRPNTTALGPGSYTATVAMSAPSVNAAPESVAVTFTLTSP